MGTKFYTARNSKCSSQSLPSTRKILILVFFLLAVHITGFSQTPLSFTQIPIGNADLIAPGRGAEQWIGRTWDNGVGGGIKVPAGNTMGKNAYYRFLWGTDIETGGQGAYNWSKFDAQINAAIDNGQMFSFGIMPMCTACGASYSGYPSYLHTLMQAETNKDWQNSDGSWVPNWNSPNYIGRYQALLNAIAAHIASGTHSGKNYKDVIYYVDIRGYGDFGEWHTYPWTNTEPAGRKATSATLKTFIDMNLAAFPNYPNVIMAGAYDGGNASVTPPDVTYYALTATNSWGEIGWRRDNWGDPGTSIMLDKNGGSYNSIAFAPLIMAKYKKTLVVGEPNNSTATYSCGSMYCDLVNEINLYHATSFGNGNFPNTFDAATQTNIVAASKVSGYRLVLTGGTMTTTLSSGGAFNITLNWQNIGVSPVYENWNAVYELRNSGGTVVWSGNSAFKPKFFLPQGSATPASDNFNLSAVPAGTYSMYLIIRDPLNFKKPLPLAITGVNADGSYLIRSNITVGTGTGNQAPTANAGSNQTIQLPASTVSLTGSGADADGTIASYAWTKVSGPSGGTIGTPNAANTSITGLIQGVYSYQLTVTDNQGATGTANVQVTVNAATSNLAPSANAGANQTIQLPTSTASLSGSGTDADGTIATYVWTKVSGPSGGTMGSPNSANTSISGLIQGVYSYKLTVTDNQGATGTATVQITVNAAVTGGPFTVNAGPDQNLAAGVTTTNVSGVIPSSSPTSSDTLNLIVIQGESNAAGNANNTSALASELAIRSSVQILNHATSKFESLHIGVNNEQDTYFDNTHHGLELGLANEVEAGRLSNPTYLVKIGISGSYVEEWLPNNSTSYQLWNGWIPYVDAAVAQMKTLGKPFRIIFWQSLGLNDRYGQGTSSATFVSKMATIRANFRARYGANIPFLSTDFNNPPAQTFDWTTLWTQMAAADSRFFSIPVTGATYVDGGVHFDYAGFKLIAHNMVNTMLTLGEGPVGTGAGSTYTSTWTKVSGPAGGAISSPANANSAITGLTAGSYTFRLTVKDNTGVSVSDDVVINVTAATNQPPIATAGSDKTIQLPTSTVSLTGSGTDLDGTVASYSWSKASGPAAGTIASPTAASTSITGLVQGIYIFTLTVTDNLGATATDNIQVTVNAAVAVNQPPVAKAGTDLSITMPTSTVNINGSSSTDPDGTISSYQWTKVSGPTSFTIVSGTAVSTTVNNLTAGVYSFQLKVTDNAGASSLDTINVTVNVAVPPPNQAPVAKAGTDMSITLPANTVNINGGSSTDPDGTISSYQWTKVSGPTSFTIVSGTAVSTTVNNLTAGIYSFQLKVTDNAGASSLDTINVTVNAVVPPPNQAPVAKAGSDMSITMPTNTANMNGSSSTDPDGTISAYQWTKIGGPAQFAIANGAAMTTAVNNLTAGVYSFQLKVTDNAGASSLDTVNVTVNAAPADIPPVAKAGTDMSITLPTNTVNVNGSASTDPDGTISSYQWVKVSGPAQFAIGNSAAMNTTVNNLTSGVYAFQLKVTDNAGVSSTDTVNVTVNAAPPPPNQPPVSIAGTDQTITLPTNSVSINGSASSDPDGSISAYLWAKLSGPAQFTIGNNTTASTIVNNLTAGVYTFQLRVTDNLGAIALDTVKIIVNSAPVNQLPVANAGADISITLPTNLANLNGSASSDADGTISAYTWSQVSGPNTATIASAAGVTTGVSGLLQGSYTFSLTVTDNSGASDLDLITVIVNAAPNTTPIANAGKSKSITHPNKKTTLDGTLSTDPDGSIASYSWTELSGPTTAVITGADSSVATADSLEVGVYNFQLAVIDNSGAISTSTVKITVTAANIPVANAGADQTIALPTNSVIIDGSGSSSPSGSIVSYAWTEKSGPSIIGLSNAVQNTLNNLQAGVYVFNLVVTDNNAATASDSVTITVIPAANLAPVANAGSSINLTLPTNSTSLDGSLSSDPDGTISTYGWTRVSGPNTPVMTGANTATAGLNGLVAGQYIYQLTVTDNKGASSSALVKVIVTAAGNVPPVANAGPNQSITSPASSVILDGSASMDPDGTIASYSWVTISGPGSITINNSNTATPSVVGLQTGGYVFELTITDNTGASSKDQISVTVLPPSILPNQVPVANAGSNLTITAPDNTIDLNGSSSFDPDGTLTAFGWTQISGPSASVISGDNTSAPNVSQLIVGQYVYELTVTDNNGATNTDRITVTVNPGVAKVNLPPVAFAGQSDTVLLPTNQYTLNGSQSMDPDGTIQSYQWQEISGPNDVSSSMANNAQVNLTNLQAGQYEFQLTVTDDAGATSRATMRLTVIQSAFSVSERLSVFPNPAHTVVNQRITSPIDGTVKVDVYDMNGKLVLTSQFEKTTDVVFNKIYVDRLAPGMYTIQVNIANRKTMVSKFIKY